jgi:aminoglycoside 2''-phosphotransferase
MEIATYTALITHNFPQITIRTVQPITHGWDSFVLVVNDELIFRFPMRDDAMSYLQKELGLLPVLEPTLSTSIPHFSLIGHGTGDYPYTFVGYKKLEGLALEDEQITDAQLMALAPSLGTFFSELHRFPVDLAVQAGMQDQMPVPWRERYQGRYAMLQQRVFPRLDAPLQAKSRRLWERFLDNEALFAFQPRLIHCDLLGGHIFCDPQHGLLTGVIDWGDSTIGDPAIDFVGLHLRGGREFIERVLAHYQGTIDDAFWQRLDFYTHYKPFSELIYGSFGNEQIFEQGKEGLRLL